ncbi:MAG: prepilin peptidase [Phycisphaerales bacterium]
MPTHLHSGTLALGPDTMLLLYKLVPVAFVAVYGACIGSLLNVVAYRMPLGIGLVFPPSSCPCCKTRLTWRENIPILGWLLLRGRCRFCRSPISPEYPLVEAFVALLFGAFALLYFVVPNQAVFAGIDWGTIKPEWARGPLAEVWPTMVVLYTLLACLTAMTIIDAKTTTIPMALPWLAVIVGVVGHLAHALGLQLLAPAHELTTFASTPPHHRWTIPVPGPGWLPSEWWWVGASIGGVVGIGVGLVLLRARLITRSFADYDEWEKTELARQAAAAPAEPLPGSAAPHPAAAMWIAYPHARREMVRELAFLAPAGVLAWLGGRLAHGWATGHARPNPSPFEAPLLPQIPLWLAVLSGVLLGYLIGGGVVWLVRIGGSLGFGREALGLGDVHLMAAVGACLGWADAVLAFFGAAFVGLAWTLVGLAAGGRLRRTMPYGPYLAIATLLVLLCKPLIEAGLNRLVPPGGNLPINLP